MERPARPERRIFRFVPLDILAQQAQHRLDVAPSERLVCLLDECHIVGHGFSSLLCVFGIPDLGTIDSPDVTGLVVVTAHLSTPQRSFSSPAKPSGSRNGSGRTTCPR